MPPLSSSEIALLRKEWNAVLTDTADIRRWTPSSDGMGGDAGSWSTVTSGVKCEVMTANRMPDTRHGERSTRSALTQTSNLFYITFEVGTDVKDQDQIVTGGNTYEVLETFTETDQLEVSILCSLVV